MDAISTTVFVFACGFLLAAWRLNGRQANVTANLIDGRRIRILCVLKDPHAPRWTRGHFVIESGTWTWEPGARQDHPLMLPSDVRPVRMRPPTRKEARLNHRFLVMECTSDEGDILVAALHGQIEHVFMALTRG
ncbi:hypothetical protein ACIQNU_43040 [Streptomyces sp. NPDC091292]|uniref:hypothetical protein n=1 Tax=Streptomyces sp. NPDC091292 TaxID=3365991 RepID=UPI0038126E07